MTSPPPRRPPKSTPRCPAPEPQDERTGEVGVREPEEFPKIVDAEVVDPPPPPPKPAGPGGNGLVDYQTAVAQAAYVSALWGCSARCMR